MRGIDLKCYKEGRTKQQIAILVDKISVFRPLTLAFPSLPVDVKLLELFLLDYCTFGPEHVLESVGQGSLFFIFDRNQLPILGVERFSNGLGLVPLLHCEWQFLGLEEVVRDGFGDVESEG